MSKSITKIDDYQFIMSDELRRMAEVELRETTQSRENAIRAIREWIQKNPRIELTRMGKYSTPDFHRLNFHFSKFFRCKFFIEVLKN